MSIVRLQSTADGAVTWSEQIDRNRFTVVMERKARGPGHIAP
jgi:hypothetical protein